ncbi:hypothetical protein DMB66_20690 [Actinoplanes sp. ATCC 53533]|uniref:hypothetical protein n=1 Tax=Actinoplanes sp. ATCC 53533 TaxID=1288362 RepID=UPI000F766234|nr:hypothetical protein [Actinoplanes sp. ATCC 53533]RSM64319.1 hypothetical protein DMB66_20690 [Actinoplanes sp. ATCC 53533]
MRSSTLTPSRRIGRIAVTLVAGFAGSVALAGGAAAATTFVCKSAPVPAGKVIIAEDRVLACGTGTSKNAWTITDPVRSGITVCKVSPIPAGYVIGAESRLLGCPNPTGRNAWFIRAA